MDKPDDSERAAGAAVVASASFEQIAARIAPSKAILSPTGWTYLINDTNDFLRVFLGLDQWNAGEAEAAGAVVRQRVSELKARSIPYRKFIVPEKPVVYPEYLPPELRSLPRAPHRPAAILAEGSTGIVQYLGNYLTTLKSLGLLYFRGDTHTNWMGSWLVYRFIVQHLVQEGLIAETNALAIRDLHASIAAYDGDLIAHLPEPARDQLNRRFGHTMAEGGIELVTRLEIRPDLAQARRVDTPADYLNWYDSRETFVFERADSRGPKVVFFRDSTFDRGVMELLAEHCSRSVFVWHLGVPDMDVVDREHPDLVVHSMAERFVTRYHAFPAFFCAKAHYEQTNRSGPP